MTKVLIIQRIFSNYRKAFFDAIAASFQLLVLHSGDKSGVKQISTPYSKYVKKIQYSKNETNVLLKISPHLLKFKPDVVVTELSIGSLNMYQTFLLSKILNFKVILWGHGYNRKEGFYPKKNTFDKIRYFFMKHADALLLYGKAGKEELSKYVNPKKIFVAQNTLDTPHLLDIRNKLEQEGRKNVKRRINFEKKYNIVFIGRLLVEKQPNVLIEIFQNLGPEIQKDLGVHFVGRGEMEESLKNQVAGNNLEENFFFHGPIFDDTISGELLFTSDLMIIPGALGLSIIHAFCFDCPVITFKQEKHGPHHGPEIEYLINNKTGFLSENGDLGHVVSLITDYFNDEQKQATIKNNIRVFMENQASLEQMLSGFKECVYYCLND